MNSSPMTERLQAIGPGQRSGLTAGAYAVCSSHHWVLGAAMAQAAAAGQGLLVEATCNQVNQHGGYSGMTPAGFCRYAHALGAAEKFPAELLLIGGDHLGPRPWQNEPAQAAMTKAAGLVRQCVIAGYRKLHLDAGMPCADDPQPELPLALGAARAAQLCQASEEAWASLPTGTPPPLYVIGAEVPTPGGGLANPSSVTVTAPGAVTATLEATAACFRAADLHSAWERVLAVVVQPGVDFGDTEVAFYRPEASRRLSEHHQQLPGMLTYEVHATDFQRPQELQRMVCDHFPLLKTGPCLTHAFREAVFALDSIEQEWLGDRKTTRLSGLRRELEKAMQADPRHWRPSGSEREIASRWRRRFGYRDRIRYYWAAPGVSRAFERLLANLQAPIPMPLLSQYMPDAYSAVRRGECPPRAEALIRSRIRRKLRAYTLACRRQDETATPCRGTGRRSTG